jgi:phycocyanobilin:ferredoxin oxidoreductase
MSNIWDILIDGQTDIINMLGAVCDEAIEPEMDQFNQPDKGWINRVWKNDCIRRAHIDVVDARDSKGLWMMHVCIFPVLGNDAPIYGFDVIAGKNKITGAFLDLSPTVHHSHEMMDEYAHTARSFIPKKKRTLPEWATNIFSKDMVAAGNVNTVEEAEEIVKLALETLNAYLTDICLYSGKADDELVRKQHDWYCHNQQQNPHTPRVMKSLGLAEADVELFCKDILFPKTA